jgi:aspartate/methionine/tyrosine aminotransferase
MSTKYPFTVIKQEIARRQGAALDFAVGTQPLPLSPEMAAWIREHSDLALVPGTPDDIAAFAAAAALYMQQEYSLDMVAEHVLPTGGGRAGMGVLAACALRQGDNVLVTEPGYPAFARLAEQRGANVIVSELDPDAGFAPQPGPGSALAQTPFTMLAVNYPNNPSGATVSAPVMERLRELSGPGTVLFNDATYGPLVYDDAPRSMLAEQFAGGHRPEVVELHSFSKLYPVGPLAVSFLASPAELLQDLKTYSEYAWSPLSRLQLATTARCLEDRERIQRFRDLLPQNLADLQATLQALGFRTHAAHAGTYMICDVPETVVGARVESAQHAARLLMDALDIAVVPLDTASHHYLRFTALYRPHDLERLAALDGRLGLS